MARDRANRHPSRRHEHRGPRRQRRRLAYDALNRLTDRDATLATGFGGDTTEDFTHDALGRLTRAKDDDRIAPFSYDSRGRVLTEKQGENPLGTSAKTVTCSYWAP